MHNRQRGFNIGLFLLASQVLQLGLDNIPPITLVTLGFNVYLFLFPAKPLLQACISVQQAYTYGDWRRLLFSPFHHVDDWHLYFNMVSFLWKGVKLEHRLSSSWFAFLLAVFSLLTGLVYLLLEAGLSWLMDDQSYNIPCAVGFSGVLFGLKVVNNYYNPSGVKYIMGLRVANCYACWVELVLIHLMNPGTSFLGHLAGILVGLLYTKGPLKTLMKTCSGYSEYRMPFTLNNSTYRQSSYGTSGLSSHPYTSGLLEEEQYEAAIHASLQDQGRSNHTRLSYRPGVTSNPSVEELRKRRLQRFES
ncbi:rhomboid-related protein 4 [Trichomycterus rosablanca]|uniref:rhomboid-related protein 4 n=1 Tax=Trichomycterus rosablanca TaxID=2290929 RepID=UPI002F35F9A0